MSRTYALAGNPNCGKTTLFNELTGSNQYVGNWPGVTVEKKEGRLRFRGSDASVVDLPGIYSLSPYSAEEIVARRFLADAKPDLIIDVVDATNLERNLYLTLQLAELGRPMIVALNMMDMLHSRGMEIDVQKLEHLLGMPVIPIAASRGTGIAALVERAASSIPPRTLRHISSLDEQRLEKAAEARYRSAPAVCRKLAERRAKYPGEYRSSYVMDEIYPAEVMEAILRIEDIIAPKCKKNGLGLRFTAVRLIDGDVPAVDALQLTDDEATRIDGILRALEERFGERDMIIADRKYRFICGLCARCVKRSKDPGELTFSDRIDRIATHRILALPLFLGLMALVFTITFGPPGSYLSGWVDRLISHVFAPWVRTVLQGAGASTWAVSLVCDGVIRGVGSIVCFFPQILLLFFFLSILEDSGYMARAAFIMDRLLHKTGLSGRSFVPMLMGFGCSVPAIMAARTLDNERDRRMTILLTPFMSCSAKMPVYALFIAAFFPRCRALVIVCLYAAGVILAVITATVLRKTVLRGSHAPFVMELPPYRLPTFKTIRVHMAERVKDYAVRAGTVLLVASVVIWFLQSFDLRLHMLTPAQSGQSILASAGRVLAPVFKPLGFGFWQASVALVSGFVAKEAVVGTLTILYNPAADTAMTAALQSVFTPVSAVSFLLFVLLYAPCIAALSTMRHEMRSFKWAAGSAVMQTGIAWVVSFAAYQFGTLAVNLIGLIR